MEDIETPETNSEETFYIRSIECVRIRSTNMHICLYNGLIFNHHSCNFRCETCRWYRDICPLEAVQASRVAERTILEAIYPITTVPDYEPH